MCYQRKSHFIFVGFVVFATSIVHIKASTLTDREKKAVLFTHTTNTPLSDKQKIALAFLDTVNRTFQSKYWPNIDAHDYYENIEKNIRNPLYIYQGSATNFCGYAALTYTLLTNEPLYYAEIMHALYQQGMYKARKTVLSPSETVRNVAGTIAGNGKLDLHVADQLLFFTLADQFKGYVNLFNWKYRSGAQNSTWAGTNLAKFNRMLRKTLDYDISSAGSDLFRPIIADRFTYLQEKLKEGSVVLYLNSHRLNPSKHFIINLDMPTHFVCLKSITENNGVYIMKFWDYGLQTQLELNQKTFNRLIFGIIAVHPKQAVL